jgi:hypothetical protein
MRDFLKIHYEKRPPSPAVQIKHSEDEDIYVNLARLKEELDKLERYVVTVQEENGISQFPCFSRVDILCILSHLTSKPERFM